ncbi:TolC family protein [Parasegetibacter sp. NRK P23]|uniref:TolC family protein n=1 Tax=Parasegetibacter sp. NRK P23 TaxID=2942999 RepID=UPI0020442121|nr:TolC family protein [Parasegetibacter sp. NRK P23]MCM5529680.1 TolC family protein [Parasegetibacter sp. NRK P23]
MELRKYSFWFPLLLCMGCAGTLRSQDTLRITLPEAEQVFMRGNLELLAEAAQVSAVKAREIQARLYNNPTITAEWNLRDPENNKWLHVGRTGQQIFEIEQLIILGGKRKAELALAKANTQVAALNLEVLLRNLLLQLRQHAANRYILELSLNRYAQQITQFSDLVKQVELQVEKKNMPARDLLRLQSTLLQLLQERAAAESALSETDAAVKLLLGTPQPVKLTLPPAAGTASEPPVVDSLIALGLSNRPEIRLAKAGSNQAAAALIHERKQVVPDLTAYANYDRQSGAFRNEFNMGVGIPIPVFSRNQGNIRAAKFEQEATQHKMTLEQQRIAGEITRAWQQYMVRRKVWEESIRTTESTLSEVMSAALVNYRKGNISLIEFMDMYESGMEAMRSRIDMQSALLDAAIQLDHSVAAEVLPLSAFLNHSNIKQ